MTAVIYKTREEKYSARRKMLEAKLELEKKVREKMTHIQWQYMGRISAERINAISPYKVTQVDDLSVRFCTNAGTRYIVGFTPDVFIFDENAYEFYIINETATTPQDHLVFRTIVAIIEDLFFDTSQSALIYICAPNDNQQAVRGRLFQIWFAQANKQEEYTLETYESIDDGQAYFYGLIIRRDNPLHDELIMIFRDFLVDY